MKLNKFFQNIGIINRLPCPHTHQQNGAIERKHRHIIEIGLALLAQSSIPVRFWDEAFLAACYLINQLPSKVIENCTPLERLLKIPPNYTILCVKMNGAACPQRSRYSRIYR